MTPCLWRPSDARRARAAIALLLALGVALAAYGATEPLHLHDSDTAGLYNEDHVLAALESLTAEAALPGAPPSAGIDLAPVGAALVTPVPRSAPAVRLADSRAPPLA